MRDRRWTLSIYMNTLVGDGWSVIAGSVPGSGDVTHHGIYFTASSRENIIRCIKEIRDDLDDRLEEYEAMTDDMPFEECQDIVDMLRMRRDSNDT